MNSRQRLPFGLRSEAGQSTVEFVLVLPVLVMALLAVVQVGVVIRDSLAVQNLAREAARAAAVEPTLLTAQTAVRESSGRLDSRRVKVELDGGSDPGELVTATVHYDAPTSVPIVGLMVGDAALSASVTMRVE